MAATPDFQRTDLGPLDQWRAHHGGFTEAKMRDGRRVVDHELPMQFVGMTANALVPGEEAGYWHTHSSDEELYVFLDGAGQMALDDQVLDVSAGTCIRVGQGVWRTWRCLPDSPTELRWLCIRGDGGALPHLPDDATRDDDRPSPWTD